jgi:UrcA family protein
MHVSVSVPKPNTLPEIEMDTKTSVTNAKPFICIAALAACALLSGPLQSREVTVKIRVNATGLDLSQPADARKLYGRLRQAADIACGNGNQVALEPVADFENCYEQTLADAVRSVNRLQLTIAYLATHTERDAATHGIQIPARLVAK